jgi:hypothetical protein
MPDLEEAVRWYLNNAKGEQPSVEFVRSLHMGRETRSRGLVPFLTEWVGNQSHLWMWDFKSFQVELERAGFTGIRRAACGDSPDPHFRDVEDPERWRDCLGVECLRPGP